MAERRLNRGEGAGESAGRRELGARGEAGAPPARQRTGHRKLGTDDRPLIRSPPCCKSAATASLPICQELLSPGLRQRAVAYLSACLPPHPPVCLSVCPSAARSNINSRGQEPAVRVTGAELRGTVDGLGGKERE